MAHYPKPNSVARMIAGWVVLICDEPNRCETADSAHQSRAEAVTRAEWLVKEGNYSIARVTRLDPYGGEEVRRISHATD